VRQNYRMDSFLSDEEQDLIESLPPFADDIADSFRAGTAPDDSVYHLFDDGSLWLKTNAYSSIWTDARDFAVEIIIPRMELSRMDADLLEAIDMDDAVKYVRDHFFVAFAFIVMHELNIQFSEAREKWYHYCQELEGADRLELGGYSQGEVQGQEYLEWLKTVG